MKNNLENPKVMLHYILPPNTSGPNTSMERLESSWLKDHYNFGKLIQDERPGRLLNLRLLKKMIAQIKSFDPDIIHISGLQSAGFYAVLAARIAGHKRIIVAVRGSAQEAIEFNPLFKFLYGNIIEPLTMKLSKTVYTVCYYLSDKFCINKRKNFAGVIHNPAPIVEVDMLDRKSFRKENHIDENSTVVTIVGRMIYDKGASFIIEGVKKIQPSNIVFVFAGDGPYCDIARKELKREIENGKVFILEKRTDVFNILAGSNIFLFATLHENLSNALLEACSIGLSVIATNVGGNKEVIENGVNGLLIPSMDSQAIVKAVSYLHNNKETAKELGAAAKKNVEENFSQEVIYKKVANLYRNALN